MKTLFFFGDSLTLGVNDIEGGWVRRFARLASAQGLSVPPATFYNLGVRKQSSIQIRARWKTEFHTRSVPEAKPFLIFCFGTVDMATPKGSVVVPFEESVQNARHIIIGAQQQAPTLLLSPLPVAQPEHNERLASLTQAYAQVCQECRVPFFDLFSRLHANPAYMHDLTDGLHPEAIGNTLIAEELMAFPQILNWIQ